MVEYNKQQQKITITMNGDASMLVNTQIALIQLMKNFNFSNADGEGIFYWALNLLESMLPEEEQQERAIVDGKYIQLPKNVTETQIVKIGEAFRLFENEPTINSTNPVFQALKKVG